MYSRYSGAFLAKSVFRRVFESGIREQHGAEIVSFKRSQDSSEPAVAVYHDIASLTIEQQPPQSILCCELVGGLIAHIHATKVLPHHRFARSGIYPGGSRGVPSTRPHAGSIARICQNNA